MVMKLLVRLTIWFLAGMLVTGCRLWPWHAKHPQSAPTPAPQTSQTVVKPDNSLKARVSRYNADARFVVLSFPVGELPKLGQTLFLYRNGLKVAEVKVTGPQDENNNIVADVITGDAQVGDEVRDR